MEANTAVYQAITDLMAPDNSKRLAAENLLKQSRQTNSDDLVQALLQILVSNADASKDNVSVMAGLMLKKMYLDDRAEEKDAQKLTDAQVQELVQKVQESIQFTQSDALLKRKAEIVSKGSAKLKQYEQLVKFVEGSLTKVLPETTAEAVKEKEYDMYVLELLTEYHLPQELIVQSSDDFIGLFKKCLVDPSPKIKVASLRAITTFLSAIDDEAVVLKYQNMMGDILQLIIEVMKEDEQAGQASLESMTELTQAHADIWLKDVSKLLLVVSEILRNNQFEDGTRQAALEIVSTLAEQAAGMLRKFSADIKGQLFPALLVMMSEVEDADDLDKWAQDQEMELLEKNDPSSVAADSLSRIAEYLGEKTTVGCCTELIQQALGQADWKVKQAGFLFLGMISEACGGVFKKNMQDVIKMSVSGLQDEHPRVRFQSLTSLGLLLNQLSPDAQQKYHQDLAPVLIKMMNSEELIKMQTQATSCMVNFVNGLIENETEEFTLESNKECLAPYATDLMQTISVLLQKSLETKFRPLQEQILHLLSSSASVLEDYFEQYYNQFMPGLKQILASTNSDQKEQAELRSTCISTIGYIVEALREKPEVCKDDCKLLSDELIKAFVDESLDYKDPQVLSIQNTIAQLAAVMKSDFKPYLNAVMPALIRDASGDVDFKVVDAESAEGKAETDDAVQAINVKVKGLEGEKQVMMNTTKLENKINAVITIKSIARSLQTEFFDHIDTYSKLCVETLMSDMYASTVRQHSTKTLKFLLDACQDSEQMKSLWSRIFPAISEEMAKRHTKLEFDSINMLLKELYKCIKRFYTFGDRGEKFADYAQIKEMIVMCYKVCSTVIQDKTERLKQIKQAISKMDEEDIEAFWEDVQNVDKALHHVMEISGVILHVYKEEASNDIKDMLLPLYLGPLDNVSKAKEYEIIDSICFLCDCVERGNDALFEIASQGFVEKFLEIQNNSELSQNEDIVQSIAFGLGVLAQRTPKGSFAQLQQVKDALGKILPETSLDATEESRSLKTENALGSLGKLVMFHLDGSIIVDAHAQYYLNNLPLKEDTDEAQAVHKLLFQQIIAKNANLVQPQHETAIKGAVERINAHHTAKPKDEILDDQAVQLLPQVVALLS